MDERRRRAVNSGPRKKNADYQRRPDRNAQRSGNSQDARRRRPGKMSSRARRRRRNMIIRWIIFVFLIMAGIGAFVFWQRYGSSDEKADLIQYYGLESESDLAVVINNEVIRKNSGTEQTDEDPAPGRVYDGQYYIEYSVVREKINKRFYWDSNENILLYTLPQGSVSVAVGSTEYTDITEKKRENYVILKTEGKTAYIALSFIQAYTNMEYAVYDEASGAYPSRIVITSEWGEIRTAKMKRDTQVRYQGGVKSPILTEVKKSDKVTVLEDEDDWMKVATEDGFVGYVKTSALKNIEKEVVQREFEEPVYTNITKDYTINMAWHNVSNSDANNYVLQTIAGTKGLTTIAPTWFSLSDTEGNISSLADADYVNYAHQSNLEVWAVLRDFHGGVNSYEETYQVLSFTSKRTRLINQVIAKALETGVDGINLDFELISTECGEHYIQFVRELSVKCRQNGLVFSVDNYVPQPYNEHYDLEEQGLVADYVVLMGYDEHTDASYEAGSVASIGYLENGISDALESVSADKLIAGIPFFTRLWFVTPKSDDELAQEKGTEAAMYPDKISSYAYGMDEAAAVVSEAGVQTEWNSTTKQNYASWEADGGTYKIWLEDLQSLEEKLKVIKSNNLAGVAEWSLGQESSGVWDLILQYVN